MKIVLDNWITRALNQLDLFSVEAVAIDNESDIVSHNIGWRD
jgi:hypothetical protein